MKSYAYLDKGNILHVVSTEQTAREFSASGIYKITDINANGGYPLIADASNDNALTEVIVYSLNEAYIKGNNKDGIKIDLNDYPKVLNLYKEVK